MATQMKPLTVALVGQPNAGKSALMNHLTGAGAMVSNYPGTTVEVIKGNMEYAGKKYLIVDTPGIYTLHSDTKEQQVTQLILLENKIDLIINVIDITNLDRGLYLTLQLLDLNIPLVIALNQIDRAHSIGLRINRNLLEKELGVSTAFLSATKGEGLENLKEIMSKKASTGIPMHFSGQVEESIARISAHIAEISREGKHNTGFHSARTLAIHLLEHDQIDEELLKIYPDLKRLIEKLQKAMGDKHPLCPDCFRGCAFCPAYDQQHLVFLTCLERTAKARKIADSVSKKETLTEKSWAQRFTEVVDHPASGIPILLLTVYLSFKLVILTIQEMEKLISSFFDLLDGWLAFLSVLLPSELASNILVKSLSEGITIPFCVVLPAMLSVYTLVSVLEDSGLLPRLAVSFDGLARFFGLPGHSFIPLILGLGCCAPAVLSTRILPQRRERYLVIALLGITIPCAASLGIIAAVVADSGASLPVIFLSIFFAFLFLCILLGHFLPGEKGELILEVPPLRLPGLKNIFLKTWVRTKCFFTEVVPLILVMSFFVRVFLELGVVQYLKPAGNMSKFFLGIPPEALIGVIVTIAQRYLAPLVLLNLNLSAREATIACTMIALSFPCLPVSVLVLKEMGGRALLKILAFAGLVSFMAGLLLNLILPA